MFDFAAQQWVRQHGGAFFLLLENPSVFRRQYIKRNYKYNN